MIVQLENLNCPYYHEVKCPQKWDHSCTYMPLLSRAGIFAKIKQFCWCDLKICTSPIIKSWNFLKNKTFWKFALPLLSRAEIFAKIKRFVEVIRKFALPLLSQPEIFAKKSVLLKWFENLNCPYYHELIFSQKCKNKAVLLKCFENLNCPYHHELISAKNTAYFMKSLENPDCPYYHGLKF